VCSHTTVKAFDGDALVLVVDCPPDIFASLRQRFVEVVEESHNLSHSPQPSSSDVVSGQEPSDTFLSQRLAFVS